MMVRAGFVILVGTPSMRICSTPAVKSSPENRTTRSLAIAARGVRRPCGSPIQTSGDRRVPMSWICNRVLQRKTPAAKPKHRPNQPAELPDNSEEGTLYGKRCPVAAFTPMNNIQ